MAYEHGGNVHKQLRENGGSLDQLLDFSANINPLGVSELGYEKLLASLSWMTHYPDPEYVALHQALSSYYKCRTETIGLFNGAAEGMHTLFAYLNPKTALLMAPSFVEYEKILDKLGTQIQWHLLKSEQQFYLDEVAYLEQLSDLKPEMAILCTPNNPTGHCIRETFLLRVAFEMAKWGGKLILDEAFVDFLEEPKSEGLFAKVGEASKNVYVFRSMTKFFAMPGLRLGAVLTYDEVFLKWLRTYGVSWRINSVAEAYAIGATQDETYIKESRSFMTVERKRVWESLREIKGITVFESEADYHLIRVATDLAIRFKEQLLRRGIMIRDCSNYKGLSEGYFRVAVKTQKANTDLVRALKEVMTCL